MKILLIHPRVIGREPTSFPLGLGYVARYLIDAGHNVQALDMHANKYTIEDAIKRLKDYDFDVIGLTGIVTQYNYIKKLVGKIKELHPKKKIVIGGPLATIVPELLLQKTVVDVVVVGEGELTAVDLAKTLEKNGNLNKVRGIYFRTGRKIVKTAPRPLIQNLDDVPFPAWDIFPIEIYLKYHIYGYGDFNSMNLLTGRGCPYKCIYCNDAFHNQSRLRSPENIIEEMEVLKEKYKVSRFSFSDETFVVNRDRVVKFCNLLIEKKMNITWDAAGRVNVSDLELLKLMKKSGCVALLYGIESANQKNLNTIRKGVTLEQQYEGVMNAKKAGVHPRVSIMIGIPGETKESIEDTVRYMKKVNELEYFFYFTPYPGTPVWAEVKRKGLVKDDDEYLSRFGDGTGFGERIYLNMTDFSDDELKRLKEEAQRRMFINYMKNNALFLPFMALKKCKDVGLPRFGYLSMHVIKTLLNIKQQNKLSKGV
ncbi:MAG: radical SAM protein [Candidatus Aenigmatarchaeota archaeon]